MTQTVEVSVLLLDSVLQSMERLVNEVPDDAVQSDDQAVMEELRELLYTPTVTPDLGVDDADEEKGAEPAVEAGEEAHAAV